MSLPPFVLPVDVVHPVQHRADVGCGAGVIIEHISGVGIGNSVHADIVDAPAGLLAVCVGVDDAGVWSCVIGGAGVHIRVGTKDEAAGEGLLRRIGPCR